jgi:hypothetical protein
MPWHGHGMAMHASTTGAIAAALLPLQVSFTAKGGHSSMPPTDATSVGAIMGRVLTRLERHQLPPWLPQSMVEQLQVRHAFASLSEQLARLQLARPHHAGKLLHSCAPDGHADITEHVLVCPQLMTIC